MDTVSEVAAKIMNERHLGYPVMERGAPVGIVTLEDISKVAEDKRSVVFVEDIMSKSIISLGPEAQAFEAMEIMTTRDIGRLLVIENGALLGIVSRTDILRAIDTMRKFGGVRI